MVDALDSSLFGFLKRGFVMGAETLVLGVSPWGLSPLVDEKQI